MSKIIVDPASAVNYNELLEEAAMNNDVETARELLRHSFVNPLYKKYAAFRWAVINNNTEIVRLLLARSEVDPSAFKNGLIELAVHDPSENVEMVKLLLEHPKVDPTHAFLSAVSRRHYNCVKLFLGKIVPTQLDDSIEYAAKYGDMRMLTMLLRAINVSGREWVQRYNRNILTQRQLDIVSLVNN